MSEHLDHDTEGTCPYCFQWHFLGRIEGSRIGRQEGEEEGRAAGYETGYRQGFQDGRDAEFQDTLQAITRHGATALADMALDHRRDLAERGQIRKVVDAIINRSRSIRANERAPLPDREDQEEV